MTSAAIAWNTVGNIANMGSIGGLVIQGATGIVAGYQMIGSPYTSLRETWRTLKDIKISLEAIPDGRRQKIEAAAQRRLCRSLTDIEKVFQDLWDVHSELSQQYEESSHIKRHFPGELRSLINTLHADVKALLHDTRTTTTAHAFIMSLVPPPPPVQNQRSNSTNVPTAGPGADLSFHETSYEGVLPYFAQHSGLSDGSLASAMDTV
ncbi:hypothetical protein BJV74DRAFT_882874 [Russula compacta]|nr:hypothetical protein BJV74DRAFT_882874 [Russula compacta]